MSHIPLISQYLVEKIKWNAIYKTLYINNKVSFINTPAGKMVKLIVVTIEITEGQFTMWTSTKKI